jgi:SMODS-associating 2TM, beta-strand rich effector domain
MRPRNLWHWWPFYPYLHKRPDLRGTWKGQLGSNYLDPESKELKPAIEVYIVVRQTYSTIDVRLFSRKSSSVSLSGNFFADNIGLYTLACTYRNTPTILRRKKSPIIHGGLLMSVRGTLIHRLEGEYWTDRNTAGEIVFTARSADEAHDFTQAQLFKYKSVNV